MRERLLSSVDETSALGSLRGRGVNYDPAAAPGGRPDGHWHIDAETVVVDGLGPDPQADAQADRAQRGRLQV